MISRTEANYIEFIYNVCHPKPKCSSPPFQYYIEPTNNCNLKCSFCIRQYIQRPKGTMKLQTFKRIIDSIVDCYGFIPCVDLSRQGEALLVSHLPEMIRYAKQKGCESLRVQTNGVALNEEKSRALIEAGLDKINFSFGSIDENIYDSVQSGGNFKKTIEEIIRFLELKQEYNTQDLEVVISTVEFGQYKKGINQFKEIFSKLPFDRIKINKFQPWVGYFKNPNEKKKSKIPMEQWRICNNPWRILSFDWDGTAIACNDDFNDVYKLGSISNNSVEELWNGPAMQHFREAHISKKYENIGPLDNNICLNCGAMFENPLENGPTYPITFQTGLHEMVEHQYMGGRSEEEIYTSKEETSRKYDYLNKNKDTWMKMLHINDTKR